MRAVIGGLLIILALILMVAGGTWLFRVMFAEQIGQGNAEIQIESAESRIVRYEHFYDVCVSVQNAEAAIDAETKRLDSLPVNSDEYNRVMQNISANEMVRANGINEYNSMSSQYYTAERFQGWNLPETLSTQAYEAGGSKTQCAI